MNNKQFNRALDEISDGLIDAAAGAYKRKSNQKKTIIRVACAACAVLVLTVAGLLWWAPTGVTDPTQPTISLQNPTTEPTTQPEATEPTQEDVIVETGNVYFLSATEEGAELAPLQANMTKAVDHRVCVRSLKGMTEHEKYLARLEEIYIQGDFQDKYSELLGEWSSRSYRSDEAIIWVFSGGFSSVLVLDNSQIESVTKETTGVLIVDGTYGVYFNDHTYGEGEWAVTIPAGCRRIHLSCGLGGETLKIFEENPDTPLSTIRDTITITINYKNGTKEIVVIDVTVDDEGQIYMTQRGANTGA